MNAIDFFRSKELRLPLSRAADDQDFGAFLKRKFEGFLTAIDKLDSDDPIAFEIKRSKADAKDSCEKILAAVDWHLRGLTAEALSFLQRALKRQHVEYLMPTSNQANLRIFHNLFRVRSESNADNLPVGGFGRGDLFHIPFHKRERVDRQRYSIQGLPCLYLGGALYVCWHELKRPPFHSLYVSAFRPRAGASITVLDLSHTPAETAMRIEEWKKQPDCAMGIDILDFAARAVCWPLQAACSIRRLHKDSPFVAEYVVPQLLLQWVTNFGIGAHASTTKVDGIAYFSVNCGQDAVDFTRSLNFVFPAQENRPSGYCPILRDKFELTKPESWQMLSSLDIAFGGKIHFNRKGNLRGNVAFGDGEISYAATPFACVEGAVQLLQFGQLPEKSDHAD